MIVAYKAGNGTDVTARILAQYAEKYVGQTIVIENVDGGSGSIGWSQIAAAAPDGMTIGFMNLPNFNSSIVKGLGTYTTADFAAICNHVTETSLVLVRADDERFNDIDDLVAYAKENQTVASTNGAQVSNHIGAQAFANSAGFKYIDLPQGNTADELTSLLGKEADWCVAKAADIAGRTDVKPLAVFSTERIFEFPDVPTLGEKGYYDQWLGSSRCVVAPAGVSRKSSRSTRPLSRRPWKIPIISRLPPPSPPTIRTLPPPPLSSSSSRLSPKASRPVSGTNNPR